MIHATESQVFLAFLFLEKKKYLFFSGELVEFRFLLSISQRNLELDAGGDAEIELHYLQKAKARHRNVLQCPFFVCP